MTSKKNIKNKQMTEKEKEDLRKLMRYEAPGVKAVQRIMQIAQEGYLDKSITKTNPIYVQIEKDVKRLGKALAKAGRKHI